MPGGAPEGNQNAAKAKLWTAAITRALDKRTRKEGKDALDELAETLLTKCDDADLAALKELGDRIEGRPAQTNVLEGQLGIDYRVDEIARPIIDAANNTDS